MLKHFKNETASMLIYILRSNPILLSDIKPYSPLFLTDDGKRCAAVPLLPGEEITYDADSEVPEYVDLLQYSILNNDDRLDLTLTEVLSLLPPTFKPCECIAKTSICGAICNTFDIDIAVSNINPAYSYIELLVAGNKLVAFTEEGHANTTALHVELPCVKTLYKSGRVKSIQNKSTTIDINVCGIPETFKPTIVDTSPLEFPDEIVYTLVYNDRNAKCGSVPSEMSPLANVNIKKLDDMESNTVWLKCQNTLAGEEITIPEIHCENTWYTHFNKAVDNTITDLGVCKYIKLGEITNFKPESLISVFNSEAIGGYKATPRVGYPDMWIYDFLAEINLSCIIDGKPITLELKL